MLAAHSPSLVPRLPPSPVPHPARSGLDATTARNLLSLLRDLSSSGRAIITTIHQPSSRLYLMLDTVLLLSQVRPEA